MKDDWLKLPKSGEIDVREIMRQVRARAGSRAHEEDSREDPVRVTHSLWKEMIAPAVGVMAVPITPLECDIYPHGYVIDWHIPLLGPVNSIVRRVINQEIHRFLDSALRQQSQLNRRFLDTLTQLAQENAQLRYEVDALMERIDTANADTPVSPERR